MQIYDGRIKTITNQQYLNCLENNPTMLKTVAGFILV